MGPESPGASQPAGVERFEQLVAELLGFKIADERRTQLAELLEERMAQTGCRGHEAYFARWLSPQTRQEEMDIVIQRVTVNETYFFREADQLNAFVALLPQLWSDCQARGRPLRILCAGCSTGEEPYSLAILIRESYPEAAERAVQIVGVDLNRAMLERARRGSYTEWSLRQTSSGMRARYFTQVGQVWVLQPWLRNWVEFDALNLVDARWSPESFDVIFCRNVFIYFSTDTTRRVVEQFTRALRPQGYLFLGSAETLRNLPTAFELVQDTHAFFYRLGLGGRAPLPAAWMPSAVSIPLRMDSDWVSAVERSAERVSVLTTPADSMGVDRPQTAPNGNAQSALRSVDEWLSTLNPLALFRDEKFVPLLEALAELPDVYQSTAPVQRLRASALVSLGRLTAAEAICRSLLILDGLNPEAHFLLALCRAGANDIAAAMVHHQNAIGLDPTFAMPRLHLGVLLRRTKDVAQARTHLRRALELLLSETPERVVLFGGGFSREGVLQLCQAELATCGGAR